MDLQGSILDQQGYFVDHHGNFVNHQGSILDHQDYYVDHMGYMVYGVTNNLSLLAFSLSKLQSSHIWGSNNNTFSQFLVAKQQM